MVKQEMRQKVKVINIAKSYRGWEVLESHDHPLAQKTWNIEKEKKSLVIETLILGSGFGCEFSAPPLECMFSRYLRTNNNVKKNKDIQ